MFNLNNNSGCSLFQIVLIKEKSEKLKERIYEYERATTNQIEEDSTVLMTKKEQLEESYTKVHKWLRDSHVTELAQQRQQMSEELKKETDVELGRSGELISIPVIINRGMFYDVTIYKINIMVHGDYVSMLWIIP